MMATPNNHPPRLLAVACWLTRSDPELAGQSNRLDQMTIIWNTVALLTVTLVAVIAWTAFFSSFLRLPLAIPSGVLVGAIVFLIDQAMGASDWEVAGVLRTESFNWLYWSRLGLRIIVALLLAQATAVGVTLYLFGDAIDSQLQAERNTKNAVLEQEYTGHRQTLEERLVGPVEKDLQSVREARAAVQREIQTSVAARDEARQRAAQARLEAGREIDGLNRPEGPGPRWRDAVRQEAEANQQAAHAEETLRAAQTRGQELDARLAGLTQTLAVHHKEYEAGAREIDGRKTRDPRWAPERNDSMLRYIALGAIKQDPVYGKTATEFNRLIMIMLMTFELIFLLIKVVFAPASVYTVRLIQRTKLEAAAVSAEFKRGLDGIRGSQSPRPVLRVVSDRPPRDEQPPHRDGGQP